MSNTAILKTEAKARLSVKAQTLATIAAIAGAVALPQLFHAVGAVSGLGTALGEAFLPMHLPVLLVGLLAGPYAGGITGLLGPAISYLLSGMPKLTVLPFMMIELCVYGLAAGLLRNVKMPTVAKVVAAQLAGRLMRVAAIAVGVSFFGVTGIAPASVWKAVVTGLFGLILQWAFLPLIVYRVEHGKNS